MRTARHGETRWSSLKITPKARPQSSPTLSPPTYAWKHAVFCLIPNEIKWTSFSWNLILPSLRQILRREVFWLHRETLTRVYLRELCSWYPSSPSTWPPGQASSWALVKHLFQKVIWCLDDKQEVRASNTLLYHFTFNQFLSSEEQNEIQFHPRGLLEHRGMWNSDWEKLGC